MSEVFIKYDRDKSRVDLIPPEFLEALGVVLAYGARKYSPRNWEQGAEWSRYYAALLRHLFAWWRGEDKDPETGYSHLWHATACLAFLTAYESRSIGKDDRPKGKDDYVTTGSSVGIDLGPFGRGGCL